MRLASSALAGAAGSLAMDVVQAGFAASFERDRAAGDLDEETEAIASVVRRIAPLVPGDLVRRRPDAAGRVVHYAFGAGFGLAYTALRARWRPVAAGGGLAFGTALWLLSDALLIPAAHLGRPWFRYSRAERLNALVAHLAFALTVEAIVAQRAGRA